jgi:PAS domain S-box-containing protein
MEQTADEIKRLQGCINDLSSIFALPVVWSGHTPPQIVGTLLDALLRMLRLDFAYVRLSHTIGGRPIEMIRLAHRGHAVAQLRKVGRALNRWLASDPPTLPLVVPNPVGEGEVAITPLRLGLQDDVGILVAGSQRPDFPMKVEMFLLQVAANQAAIGLHDTRRVREQRRAAEEIERRVSERTRQLIALNEELRKEVHERKRSEQCVATQYAITRILAESDTLADAIPCLLQAIGESMAWEWGALWNIDRGAGVLRCESIWHAPNLEVGELDAISQEIVGMPGQGIKGRVGQKAEPTWMVDATQDTNFARAPIAAGVGLHGAIAFPIILRGETIGVMEFFSHVVRQPNDEQLAMLLAIGNQIGQFVERKRVEEALRTSEQHRRRQFTQLEAIYRTTPVGLCVVDPQLRLVRINRLLAEMIGQLAQECVGHALHEVMPGFADQLEPICTRVIQIGVPVFDLEIRGVSHADSGGERIWRTSYYPFASRESKMLGVNVVVYDITERRQAEEALHKAQEELSHATRVMTMGELTASIAHEVNQPLTAVINNANACLRWLSHETSDLDAVRGALRDIIANGQRASDVITRIRVALKKAPTPTVSLQINEVIAEAIGLTHREIQQYGVQLRTELAGDLPPVSGDRVQIQQVLLNLLMNGIEAMSTVVDRPRKLLIRSGGAGANDVLVAVRDSGIGLDSQTMERMFDAFYTTKPEGMGMGLSISRTIIKMHGGRLWAEPNSGHGATFQFTLPIVGEHSDN